MKPITIVHLADMHVSVEQTAEFKKRSKAFLADLAALKVSPDLVVISGDLSFSGKKDQYDIVQRNLLAPLCKATGIEPHQIVIGIGNHDIDRAVVDPIFEKGVLATVKNGDFSPLVDDEKFKAIEGAFIDFCASNGYKYTPVNVFDFDGLKVGIAVLNSTRLCLSRDCPKGDVRIPIEAINHCLENMEDCAFRIATYHHPFEWFSDDDLDSTISEIKHSFDLILNGHIHDSQSEGVVSPNASYLHAIVPSFFRGTSRQSLGGEGYSIYQIDPIERTMLGTFRKYAYKRHEYDKDTDSARDGAEKYKLPKASLVRQGDYGAVLQSGKVRDFIKGMLDKNSLMVQQITIPVYVEPDVYSISINSSGDVKYQIVTNKSFEKHVSIFYAVPDVGSTTFFQKMCCDTNKNPGMSVIIEAKELTDVKTEKHLLSLIERKYKIESLGYELLAQTTLIVDEFSGNSSEDLIRIINLCKCVDKLIVCVKNSVLFDAVLRGHTNTNIGFYEFKCWNANKVKEFISKYLLSAEIDLSNTDSAVRFIVHSFSHTDLPITPFLLGMYLRIFFKGNGTLTSLSFIDLLEQMETSSFAQDGGQYAGKQSTVYTKHYYQKFLTLIAERCQENQTLYIDKKMVVIDFKTFIDKIGLEIDIEKFVNLLTGTGILLAPGDGTIGFSCYAFFRYYLSLSFEGGEARLLSALKTTGDIQAIGDAVPYYIHKHRDCKELCDSILGVLKESMPSLHEVYPEELDRYAIDILSPIKENDSVDDVANRVSQIKINDEEIDQEFERRQTASRKEEEYGLKRIPAHNAIEKVSQNLVVLRILYNVFRNLEEVDFNSKCETLDAILTLHLAGIMQMIECFSDMFRGLEKITSLFAYLVAIWGSGFLSEHIASDTLKRVIREVHNKTDNPLKRFLLICIMIELGMDEHAAKLLVELVSKYESTSVIEMAFYKIKESLIRCESKKIPPTLMNAFKTIYKVKAKMQGEKKRKSDYLFNIEITDIQKGHLQHLQEKLSGKTSDLKVLIQKDQ